MKNRKKSFGIFLFATLLLFAAGCSGSGDIGVLPTYAPTHTPEPEVNIPDPTTPPDAGFTKVIELNGEDFNQTSRFAVDGEGVISVKPVSYAGSYSFCLSGRGEATHGLSVEVANKEGDKINVSGKNLFVAMWVYHEGTQPENFSLYMQAKKPDGTTETIGTLSKEGIPAKTWTLVEGVFPIYANVTDPKIRMELTSSKESFYFDDFRMTFDSASTVGANKDYSLVTFDGIYCDFEDLNNPFVGRGGVEKMQIKNGGGEDGKKCLLTTNRTANWNGPSLDITQHELAGTTLYISFLAAHGGDTETPVICTIMEVPYGVTDDSKASYTQIAVSPNLAKKQWAEVSGEYTLKENTGKAVIYFETAQTEDIYIDNIMLTAKDPETVEIDPNTGTIGDKKEEIDLKGFEEIVFLTADGAKTELDYFVGNGSGQVEITGSGRSENGFRIFNRAATWSGAGIAFSDLGVGDEVIGKEVYISFWVYQESGQTQSFSATLQANKPDGTSVWPERVDTEVLPSGEWTFMEGIIPIYANVSVPRINFEIPSSEDADIFLDDVKIMYNPDSVVPVHQAYEEANEESQVKEKLERLELHFDDNNAFFGSRGSAQCSLEYGGYESEKCLYVSGRGQQWEGAQADFSMYDIFGKTVNVSFRVYHEYDDPLPIQLSVQKNDGLGDTYEAVVTAEVAADGKWVQFNGSYYVPEGIKKIFFYFETPGDAGYEDAATKSFYIDDVIFEVVEVQ